MSTPTYKGPGQPLPSSNEGVSGWLGSFFGTRVAPVYRTEAPTAPGTKAVCIEALPRMQQAFECGDAVPQLLEADASEEPVIPVGPGPITIVLQRRG